MLNIYRVSNDRTEVGAFVEAVVVAPSEEEARLIHPNSGSIWNGRYWDNPEFGVHTSYWPDPLNVIVELIDTTVEGFNIESHGRVICADYME